MSHDRNGALSGSLTALVVSVLSILTTQESIHPADIPEVLAWVLASGLVGALVGLLAALVSRLPLLTWAPGSEVLIAAFLAILAYAFMVWLLIGYAIANPVYYP
jgi:hypothetical protein